jgi:hypothetical protein
MKHTLLFMGLISGLFTHLGCNNPKTTKIIATDSSGNVQTINPNDVLMTIPTIENTFPAFENTTDTNNLTLIEDDWRQVEFISKDQKDLIDKELDSINYIFDHEMHHGKDYSAFKKLHVRRLITNPISISFDKLLVFLADNEREIAGISITGNDGQVRNGFSLSSNGMNYYGLKDDKNNVSVFCLYGAQSNEALQKSIDRVSKFLATEKLYLVDWIHRRVIDEKNIRSSFTQ